MATTLNKPLTTRDRLELARSAAPRVAELTTEEKNLLLRGLADAMEAEAASILAANEQDLKSSGLEGAMLDRLLLTHDRVKQMANGLRPC